MMGALLVFIVQAVFMFFIDHKYRFLSDGDIKKVVMFQGVIATMYVFVIPMIASGETLSLLAYIFGSVAGTFASHKIHIKDKDGQRG